MAAQVISPIDGTKVGIDNSNKPIIVGGGVPIPNARDDPYIIGLARWALDEYNKQQQGRYYRFGHVVSASVQESTYYIAMAVLMEDMIFAADAVVLVQSPNSKKLLSFTGAIFGNSV